MTPNTRGALYMMASMAAFTFNDTCLKATAGAVPLFQLLTVRGLITSALVCLLALRLGALDFRIPRQDWVLVGLRSISEIGAAYFFLTALLNMPLANVMAILQVLPLTVTLGAALLFREQVGWRRALAIAVGFCGMLLIVRPGAEGFGPYVPHALIAVLFVTMRDLVTRRMSARVPSLTVTLSASVAVMVFSAAASVTDPWVPLSLSVWGLILASSVFILFAYLFSVMVMRVGEVGAIAPFRYTGLVWALLLGWLVFGDWPDSLTLLGAGIVVSAGLFTLYREQVVSRG